MNRPRLLTLQGVASISSPTLVAAVSSAAVAAVVILVTGCRQESRSPLADEGGNPARGKTLYDVSCGACHKLQGEGALGIGLPLAGSEWVQGSPAQLVRIALHGVRGPIVVRGKSYNLEMPAFQHVFSDAELADILTYIRQAWGNRAPPITAPQVAGVRAKEADRGDSWTVAELKALEPGKSVKDSVQPVIDAVDKSCRQRTVYMIGPQKARRLAELVREKKPQLVVECGTALGYSGLWIARELKTLGAGRLVTIELDPERAIEANSNFQKAGLADIVEVRPGDARELVKAIDGPIDFLFIDCNYGNYYPCYLGAKDRLADGALIVADNVGIGAVGMADFLKAVRTEHESGTEWFELDLPWGDRDAMEITVFRAR